LIVDVSGGVIPDVIFVVLTAFGIRDVIVKAIPGSIKVSIGFFIAHLGFTNSGICVVTEGSVDTGDITSSSV